MTRETKVGMAVACSFLGLVAAVVVLRMGNPGDSTPAVEASSQVASSNPVPPGGSGGDPAPGKRGASEPPSVLNPAVFTGDPPALLEAKPAQVATSKEPTSVTPPPSTTAPPAEAPLPPPVPTPPPIPAAPAAPPTPVVAPKSSTPATPDEPSPGAVANKAKNATPPPKAVPDAAEPDFPGLPPAKAATAVPETPAQVAQNNKLTAEEEQRKKLEELKNQVAATEQGVLPTPPVAAAPPAAVPPLSTPAKNPPAQAGDLLPPVVLPPPPAPVAGLPEAPPPLPAPPPGNPVPSPAPVPVAKDDKQGLPAAPKASDITLKGPLASMDAPPGPRSLPAPEKSAERPTAVAMGPGPLPTVPLGAPAGASSAPIAVPVPPSATATSIPPKVLTFDVETYHCKAGEATFADLSKQLYGSDKYANALLQYNREHPLATDNVRDDPPRLQPGLPIFVPPVHILEQPRYASAPAPALVSTKVSPPAAPSMVTQPRPPSPLPTPDRTPPPTVTTSTAGTQTYTVRANGEMLFEIARQALGDGRRWSEIYRLNPDIRPELAIPGGTQLRLPADARVGS